MKITILLYGTLGDVQPYVALGVGLQQAGHETTIAADPLFESLIRARNIEFASVSGNSVSSAC